MASCSQNASIVKCHKFWFCAINSPLHSPQHLLHSLSLSLQHYYRYQAHWSKHKIDIILIIFSLDCRFIVRWEIRNTPKIPRDEYFCILPLVGTIPSTIKQTNITAIHAHIIVSSQFSVVWCSGLQIPHLQISFSFRFQLRPSRHLP